MDCLERSAPITVSLSAPSAPPPASPSSRLGGSSSASNSSAFSNLAAQQRAFDRFRRSYNVDRPHEAIGMVAPRERYRRSERRMPRSITNFDYALANRCLVRRDGKIRWGNRLTFISTTLAGRVVGVEALSPRYSEVRFGSVILGILDAERPGVELIRPKPRTSGRKVSAMYPV